MDLEKYLNSLTESTFKILDIFIISPTVTFLWYLLFLLSSFAK